MKIRYTILLATVALALGACATQSSYAPADGADDYGYSSTALGNDRYRVSFSGNTSTGPNTVRDFALLRAAELTLQNNKDWFQIVERATDTTESRSPSTTTVIPTGRTVHRDCGLLGCSTSSRPTYGSTIAIDSGSSREKYQSNLEIVMGNDPMPSGDGNYYDADEIASTLRAAM